MTDFKTELENIVADYVAGRSTFTDFQRAYSACYADQNADRDFSSAEVDHYGDIHEKAEWTSLAPTAEERKLGWLDESAFREWLVSHRRIRRA